MRRLIFLAPALAALALTGCTLMVEQAKYRTVVRDGKCEVREYPAQIVAVTTVDSSLEEAGNLAFNRLFGYISGKNRPGGKIAMTAPVGQQGAPRKIAMTAPVGQQRGATGWEVWFVMPAEYTIETLPPPTDPLVALRRLPPRRMAAIRYSGGWGEARYATQLDTLRAWLATRALEPAGPPVWARYNPPFMPPFLRRNEILVPLATAAE